MQVMLPEGVWLEQEVMVFDHTTKIKLNFELLYLLSVIFSVFVNKWLYYQTIESD